MKKGCNADCCRKSVQMIDNVYIPVRCLPGIDPDAKYIYTRVFFGADREYGPDEGWQRVSYRKKGRKARRYA
jgi:hypothetical protein